MNRRTRSIAPFTERWSRLLVRLCLALMVISLVSWLPIAFYVGMRAEAVCYAYLPPWITGLLLFGGVTLFAVTLLGLLLRDVDRPRAAGIVALVALAFFGAGIAWVAAVALGGPEVIDRLVEWGFPLDRWQSSPYCRTLRSV